MQITRSGSSLFELLGKEPTLRVRVIHKLLYRQRKTAIVVLILILQERRVSQANSYVDVGEVESMIRKVIEDTNKNIAQVEQQIENISSTESSLDAKISKKENDLERVSKRLETLKGVRYYHDNGHAKCKDQMKLKMNFFTRRRPAFLEEYERYEDELNQTYDSYVLKFRCYAYLQQQLQQILNFNQVSRSTVPAVGMRKFAIINSCLVWIRRRPSIWTRTNKKIRWIKCRRWWTTNHYPRRLPRR
jgi:clusterin-associated protein 1